jgi:hypothetical protein
MLCELVGSCNVGNKQCFCTVSPKCRYLRVHTATHAMFLRNSHLKDDTPKGYVCPKRRCLPACSQGERYCSFETLIFVITSRKTKFLWNVGIYQRVHKMRDTVPSKLLSTSLQAERLSFSETSVSTCMPKPRWTYFPLHSLLDQLISSTHTIHLWFSLRFSVSKEHLTDHFMSLDSVRAMTLKNISATTALVHNVATMTSNLTI